MPAFTLTKRIHASPEVVWDVFTDFDKVADRISAIVKLELLTDGPVGLGTRFRETRIMFKREATEEMEFTDFDPPRSYTIGSESCGCEYSCKHRFVPDGNDTVLEFEMSYRPVSIFAKLMTPLGKLMQGPMIKCLEKDFDELKAVAEGDAPSPQPALGT